MLQGSLCALVTPFSDGTVDGAGYEKFVDWQIDQGGKVFEAGVVKDEFSNKEFQSCLGSKIGEIVFLATPSGRSVYVEHTFVFRKEENT